MKSLLKASFDAAQINKEVARQWRAGGVPVFPACAQTRQPAVKGWRTPMGTAATGSVHFWDRSEPYLVCIDCQSVNLAVVDCDDKEGRAGTSRFLALCQASGIDLAEVPYVLTPSGGRHYLFTQPNGQSIRNSAGKLATGIDVRGIGGFIFAAGSTLPDGRCYTPATGTLSELISMVAEQRLPAMPVPLVELIQRSSRTGALTTTNVLQLRSKAAVTTHINAELGAGISPVWTLDAAVAEICAAQEGTRNDTLNRHGFIAGRRISAGHEQMEMVNRVLAAAATTAGLSPDEVARTLDSAIAAGMAATAGAAAQKWELTQAGKPKSNLHNTKIALADLGIVVERDTFRQQVLLDGAFLPSHYHGLLTEHAETWLRNIVMEQFGFDPGAQHLHDALCGMAENALRNPVLEHLDSITWDGTHRLRGWLPRITGAADTELNQAIGSILMLGMVARARYPGTKYDSCVVIEGPQGCGKSTLVKRLAGEDYFTDAPGLLGMETKARGELIVGRWGVELSELSGLGKREIQNVKAFLSQTTDYFRPSYARVAGAFPRTMVFVGTTNDSAYLSDSTGNRRFLPVKSGPKIDIDSFVTIREQLLAEADDVLKRLIARACAPGDIVQQGSPLPDSVAQHIALPRKLWRVAEAAAEERRAVDPGEDYLREIVGRMLAAPKGTCLPDGRTFLSSTSLATALRVELGSAPAGRTLAAWMRRLGWEAAKYGRGSDQVRGYAKA